MKTEPERLPSDQDASGRSVGDAEKRLVEEVLDSGTLNCTRGTRVRDFEGRFARKLGVPFCRAVTSGTAAIHSAVAAIDPEPGDEIVTSPITDMGAITPILYQSAIPVFADVDPVTCNVTVETISRRLSRRTRAVIVTHLFGRSCDMDPILELCGGRGIPVIEDAAQAYLATDKGRLAGTMGTIGCFSLQQGKHITAGEGGIVVCHDEDLFRRLRLFADKGWGYGDPEPDHEFLALNYRMTELQGAVALAQLDKLDAFVQRRIRVAARLSEAIAGVEGVSPPERVPGSRHVYWRYPLRVDGAAGGADALGAKLIELGVACAPRYIKRLAFECRILRERRTFGRSRFPFAGEHRRGDPEVVYDKRDTPAAVRALAELVVLPLNERYDDGHADFVASAIREARARLGGL
ncbi:MAG: DegT/DnrJ/EryC1/StrS family aminotransferase [Planctomycetota bacterium]